MNDKERLILLLRGPEHYAHVAGKQMLKVLNAGKRKRTRAMLKLADNHINIIMSLFDISQNANIIKTWLSTYRLPFDSELLTSFDNFHASHGKYILDHAQDIRSY
jgi:hypothetical protein